MCWRIWFYSSEADLYVVSRVRFGRLEEAQRILETIPTHHKGLSEVDCSLTHDGETGRDVVRVAWQEQEIKRLLFWRWRVQRGELIDDRAPAEPERPGLPGLRGFWLLRR